MIAVAPFHPRLHLPCPNPRKKKEDTKTPARVTAPPLPAQARAKKNLLLVVPCSPKHHHHIATLFAPNPTLNQRPLTMATSATTVKEAVKEAVSGSSEQPPAQLSSQSRARFTANALKDAETGELHMGPEQFINAVAPKDEDFVSRLRADWLRGRLDRAASSALGLAVDVNPPFVMLSRHTCTIQTWTNHNSSTTAQDPARSVHDPLQRG